LTQQVAVPTRFSDTEILLASNETSIMLNLLDKMLKSKEEGAVNIIFDNLSDLVLTIGFEKTYNFMKSATEMLASRNITALFLVNTLAHSPTILSSLRSLFSNQIFFDRSGIRSIKLEKKVGKAEMKSHLPKIR
jgi:hypothetical protein